MSDFAIEANGLTKAYAGRLVVDSLDLKVPRGCVYGFLGRNGAGKSTTIRMLMGLLRPTRGSALILGAECTRLTPEVRARVGYLAEGHHVPDWMTVAELERFQRAPYTWWNEKLFASVIEHFRLQPNNRARDLSRGQRAGLCLALTLAPEPELLILDDPALGLDPVARQSLVQAMIYVTRQAGQTILFSSHMLTDVERVADRIAVLDGGVLRADCGVDTFREKLRRFVLTFPGDPPRTLPPIPGLVVATPDRDSLSLTIANYGEDARQAVAALGALRIEQVDLSLEEAFVDYVGRQSAQSLLVSASGLGHREAVGR